MTKSFEEFLDEFVLVKEYGYRPKNTWKNEYRHFGKLQNGKKYLTLRELRYLFSPDLPTDADIFTKLYFELKNNGYNVLEEESRELIYAKTHHFNRSNDVPVGILEYKRSFEPFEFPSERTVACVLGRDSFCFIQMIPITEIQKDTPLSLYK